jgi:hypothetical protein
MIDVALVRAYAGLSEIPALVIVASLWPLTGSKYQVWANVVGGVGQPGYTCKPDGTVTGTG